MNVYEELETIAWQRWGHSGRSTGWTKTHLVTPLDDDRTFCGLGIPANGTGNIEIDDGAHSSPCHTCRERAEMLGEL